MHTTENYFKYTFIKNKNNKKNNNIEQLLDAATEQNQTSTCSLLNPKSFLIAHNSKAIAL
jgi:hypothetical protein